MPDSRILFNDNEYLELSKQMKIKDSKTECLILFVFQKTWPGEEETVRKAVFQ